MINSAWVFLGPDCWPQAKRRTEERMAQLEKRREDYEAGMPLRDLWLDHDTKHWFPGVLKLPNFTGVEPCAAGTWGLSDSAVRYSTILSWAQPWGLRWERGQTQDVIVSLAQILKPLPYLMVKSADSCNSFPSTNNIPNRWNFRCVPHKRRCSEHVRSLSGVEVLKPGRITSIGQPTNPTWSCEKTV